MGDAVRDVQQFAAGLRCLYLMRDTTITEAEARSYDRILTRGYKLTISDGVDLKRVRTLGFVTEVDAKRGILTVSTGDP